LANLAKVVTLLPIRAQKMAIIDHARPGYPSTNTTTLFAGITISADVVNPCRPLPSQNAAAIAGELSCLLALEAVLLTSFVLMRQNAMDLQSERRNHLDLQINLLAERETTVILKKLNFLVEHLGVDEGDDRESRELAKDTPVESIARHLRSKEEEKENETG
jgi:hypothetical protein